MEKEGRETMIERVWNEMVNEMVDRLEVEEHDVMEENERHLKR